MKLKTTKVKSPSSNKNKGKMLKVAEAINGPDFTPFTDTFFYKEAGVGSSTAWHQDPSNAWDEDWKNHERSGFDVGGHCGFSFHVSLYNCDANNTLWFLPGTQFNGRMLDIEKLASGTGELPDRVPNAVPVICGPFVFVFCCLCFGSVVWI